jgi:membrane fusion protein (multidrug efflux system)
MSEAKTSALSRVIVFLIMTAGVAGAGWWYWQRQQSKQAATVTARAAKGAALVMTTKVSKIDFSIDLDAIGTVRAFESAEISPNVTEVITALHFEDGDFVRKGTLLAELSHAEETAMLESAKASLAEQTREIARLESLVKQGAAPEARLEERRTQSDIAKQRILEAEAKLADRQIVAPFDGWMGLRRISVGALVSPGTVIATLDKVDVVKIDFSIPETFLAQAKTGVAIATQADALGDASFPGKIAKVDSRIDPLTRSVAARAEVDNPKLLLKPGMLVMVKMALEPRISLSVPERSLVPMGMKKFVFVLEEGKAKLVQVEIGLRKPGVIEILTGLEEGQVVITDGLVGLQDGAAVKVSGEYTSPSEAFNPENSP